MERSHTCKALILALTFSLLQSLAADPKPTYKDFQKERIEKGKFVYLKIMHTHQEYNLCVPASAGIVDTYYGGKSSQTLFANLSSKRSASKKGTSFANLVLALQKFDYWWSVNYRPKDKPVADILRDLKNELERNNPPILGMGGKQYRHALVMVGYNKDYIFCQDPGFKNKKPFGGGTLYSIKEFDRLFRDDYGRRVWISTFRKGKNSLRKIKSSLGSDEEFEASIEVQRKQAKESGDTNVEKRIADARHHREDVVKLENLFATPDEKLLGFKRLDSVEDKLAALAEFHKEQKKSKTWYQPSAVKDYFIKKAINMKSLETLRPDQVKSYTKSKAFIKENMDALVATFQEEKRLPFCISDKYIVVFHKTNLEDRRPEVILFDRKKKLGKKVVTLPLLYRYILTRKEQLTLWGL